MAALLKRVRNKPSKLANSQYSSTQPDSRAGLDNSPSTSCNSGPSLYLEKPTDFPSQVVNFRRRLARKASTLSLRAKGRNGHSVLPKRPAVLSPGAQSPPSLREEAERSRLTNKSLPATPPPIVHKTPGDSHDQTPTQRNFSLPLPPQVERGPPSATGGSWIKMSSESSSPPVPFSKLKEITEEACTSTLSSTTSYSHPKTESWNTQIINNVLAALVKETTPTGASQPQYKYVVNSTIIQHAPIIPTPPPPQKEITEDVNNKQSGSGVIGGGGMTNGRRGMHAASGAYWNNEKDGMWSFKYEAAEAKGLDVVVGIVWVWVG